MLQVLGYGVEVIKTVLISLYPIVLLGVQMKMLDTTLDALTGKPATRCTIDLLRDWVVERIVHALLQPQATTIGLLYLVDTIITKRRGILIIGEISPDAIAVIAVQTITRTKPHIPLRVTIDAIDHRV